jgi:hypothetical protein
MDPTTPKQPIRTSDSPPPIKRKLSQQSVSYEAGDFIKPDPMFTRFETRKYILTELEHCIKRRLKPDTTETLDANYLHTMSNPRARLYQIGKMLETQNRKESAQEVSFAILASYLGNKHIDYDTYPLQLVRMVLGFVLTDVLPSGRTIQSFWDHSPFEILRNAPPLPDDSPQEEHPFPIVLQLDFPTVALFAACITLWLAMLLALSTTRTECT